MHESSGELDAFESWVLQLESFVAATSAGDRWNRERLRHYIDGAAGEAIRASVAVDHRRSIGAFFTSQLLARNALRNQTFGAGEVVLDPAVGAGDLLLAVAAKLPVSDSVEETLQAWGACLRGRDLIEAFVRATKLRLALLAYKRLNWARPPNVNLEDLFPQIAVGDGLSDSSAYVGVTEILLNPPFVRVVPPKDYPWAAGSTSSAAIFVERVLSNAEAGARLTAILPDVLRTGSNYKAFRKGLVQRAKIKGVHKLGRFDRWTNIDTFSIRLTIDPNGGRSPRWWHATPQRAQVGDRFEVSVGSVVPHRDVEGSTKIPYLSPAAVKGVASFDTANAPRRGFDGRRFSPPFLVVRRTSAPGGTRARATLVTGAHECVVENHLIVLRPVTGDAAEANLLMKRLESRETTQVLDDRLRCRHLTVPALRQLSWNNDA